MIFECILCCKSKDEEDLLSMPKGHICLRCLKLNAGITEDMVIKKMIMYLKMDMNNEEIQFNGTSRVTIN